MGREAAAAVARPSPRREAHRAAMVVLMVAGLCMLVFDAVRLQSRVPKGEFRVAIHEHVSLSALTPEALPPSVDRFHVVGAGPEPAVAPPRAATLVVGWGNKAPEAVGAMLAEMGLPGPADGAEAFELPSELIAEVLRSAGSMVRYSVDMVAPDVADRAQATADRLVGALAASPGGSRVIPEAIFFLPFVARAARRARLRLTVVLVAQDGLDAAFDAWEHVVERAAPGLVDEDAIDTLCLARLRPWKLVRPQDIKSSDKNVPARGAAAWPALEWVRRIQPISHVKRNAPEARPCRIAEVPVLRAGLVWSVVYHALLDDAYVRKELEPDLALVVIRAEDLQAPFERLARAVAALTGSALGPTQTRLSKWSRTEAREPAEPHSLYRWKTHALADRVLVGQLALVLNHGVLRRLGYPTISESKGSLESQAQLLFGHQDERGSGHSEAGLWPPLQSARDRPLGKPIDAGYCMRTKNRVSAQDKKILTRSVGRCLPSFLVLGAQKAGTDELAVWLNMNSHSRRLDGGVEVHFFDCLGRGKGWQRGSCDRVRRTSMTFNSRASMQNVTTFGPKMFTWRHLRETSPFISSAWRRYQSLGNLAYYDFNQRKSQTFEKTPAYMDLAHPMDVARLLPSARLVFMLRDPVARFVSSYFQICSGMYHKFNSCTYADLERRFDALTSAGFDPLEEVDLEPDSVDYLVHRGLAHSLYSLWLSRWRAAFPDSSIMVVFSEHFRRAPQAVVHALESFNGLRSPKQRQTYHPHRTDSGLYVLGSYSKADKPSHTAAPPPHLEAKLAAFFEPWNQRLAALLRASDIVVRPPVPVPQALLPDGEEISWDLPAWLQQVQA